MKLILKSATRLPLLAAIGLLSACSSVKELSNVNVWPFGSSEDKPRVYQPANSTPYLCEGNKKFFVRMLDNGASAWLILPDREVLLPQNGTTKAYTNGISQLDLSSEAVTLDVNETTKYVGCMANGVAKISVAQTPQVKPEVASKAEIAQTPMTPAAAIAEEKLAEPQAAKPVATAQEPSSADSKAMISDVAGQTKQAGEASITRDEPSSNVQEEVAKTLDAWARAWRTKNVDAYLSAYSAKFTPEGISKKVWLEQRKQRVGANPAEITLALDNVKIVADAKKAEVTFIQHYTSVKFSDTVAKVLRFENESGHWLITKETAQAKNNH